MDAKDEDRTGPTRRFRNAVWIVFGGTWVLTAALLAAVNVMDDIIIVILLVPWLPMPVFVGFLIAPYAIDSFRRLGRHAPWAVGFGSYFFAGAVVVLVGWAATGSAGPFTLFTWPVAVIATLGCVLGIWPC